MKNESRIIKIMNMYSTFVFSEVTENIPKSQKRTQTINNLKEMKIKIKKIY